MICTTSDASVPFHSLLLTMKLMPASSIFMTQVKRVASIFLLPEGIVITTGAALSSSTHMLSCVKSLSRQSAPLYL